MKRIYIELSNVCNLNCSFCPSANANQRFLSVEQFENIISQVAKFRPEVFFHILGEPLLSPILPDALQICQQHELSVQLTTNGILIDHFSDYLRKLPVRQINFSLQSALEQLPESSYASYLDSILIYCDKLIAESSLQYINLRLWNVGTGSDSKIEYVISRVEEHFKTSVKRGVEVKNYKSKKIVGRIYLHFDDQFDWPSLDAPNYGKSGTCKALSDQIGILSNGKVVPCCLDWQGIVELGDIAIHSIDEILTSQRTMAMLDGFQHGQLLETLCQHCSYCRRFKVK